MATSMSAVNVYGSCVPSVSSSFTGLLRRQRMKSSLSPGSVAWVLRMELRNSERRDLGNGRTDCGQRKLENGN